MYASNETANATRADASSTLLPSGPISFRPTILSPHTIPPSSSTLSAKFSLIAHASSFAPSSPIRFSTII